MLYTGCISSNDSLWLFRSAIWRWKKKILVAWHACKEEEEASRKFSRNIFVSSLTHNHICSSQSCYSFSATTNNSQGCATFQCLYISAFFFAKAVLALKVEEKQNSMWILSKIFQKQAAKQMAVQQASYFKIKIA